MSSTARASTTSASRAPEEDAAAAIAVQPLWIGQAREHLAHDPLRGQVLRCRPSLHHRRRRSVRRWCVARRRVMARVRTRRAGRPRSARRRSSHPSDRRRSPQRRRRTASRRRRAARRRAAFRGATSTGLFGPAMCSTCTPAARSCGAAAGNRLVDRAGALRAAGDHEHRTVRVEAEADARLGPQRCAVEGSDRRTEWDADRHAVPQRAPPPTPCRRGVVSRAATRLATPGRAFASWITIGSRRRRAAT